MFCPSLLFSDSVEEGEKLVKTALDAFGRIGEFSWLLWFLLSSISVVVVKNCQEKQLRGERDLFCLAGLGYSPSL